MKKFILLTFIMLQVAQAVQPLKVEVIKKSSKCATHLQLLEERSALVNSQLEFYGKANAYASRSLTSEMINVYTFCGLTEDSKVELRGAIKSRL